MKKLFTSAAIITVCLFYACTKESSSVGSQPNPTQQTGSNSQHANNMSRLSGSNYSQSIPVDTANKMLRSYLSGVGYPGVDTALRALSFDADTLRAYLQNPNIVTIKFMVAHQTSYINNGMNGINSGLNPTAVTMIIVGLNNDDEYVLNNHNGVYEHMSPCPLQCPGSSSAYIQ